MFRIRINAGQLGHQTSLSQIQRHRSPNQSKSDNCCFHLRFVYTLTAFSCPVLSAFSLINFSIRFNASLSISTVQHNDTLIYRLPASPKMKPGVINTFVPYRISSIHFSTSLIESGALAHTKSPDCFAEYEQPNNSSNLVATFFLSLYTLFRASNHAVPFDNASTAACCNPRNMPESILLFTFNTASMNSFLPATQPICQPAILCDLLREFNSRATSSAPSIDKMLIGSSLRIML